MTAQPVAPARRDRATQVLFVVAALVAVAGVAFAIGRVTAPPSASAANNTARAFGGGNGNGFGGFRANASGAPGFGGRGVFAGGGVGIRGTVESIDANTLTLKLADGSTATVDLTGSTTYHAQAAATSSDIKPGGQVQVQIQVQPRGSFAPGGAAGGGGEASPGASGATRTFTATDVMVVGQ